MGRAGELSSPVNWEGQLAMWVDPETGAGIVLFKIVKVKSTVSVFGLLPVSFAGLSQLSLSKSSDRNVHDKVTSERTGLQGHQKLIK